jgi:hypothetical protein
LSPALSALTALRKSLAESAPCAAGSTGCAAGIRACASAAEPESAAVRGMRFRVSSAAAELGSTTQVREPTRAMVAMIPRTERDGDNPRSAVRHCRAAR